MPPEPIAIFPVGGDKTKEDVISPNVRGGGAGMGVGGDIAPTEGIDIEGGSMEIGPVETRCPESEIRGARIDIPPEPVLTFPSILIMPPTGGK